MHGETIKVLINHFQFSSVTQKKMPLFDENYRPDLKYITQHSVICKIIYKAFIQKNAGYCCTYSRALLLSMVPVNCNETQTL